MVPVSSEPSRCVTTTKFSSNTRLLNFRLFWSDVQIPVNAAIFAITLLKPLVAFGKVMAVELHIVSI
jgi:hypothetical protein